MLLFVDSRYPQPRKIRRAADILRSRGLLSYPTDTIYGIGCDPFERKAVEALFAMRNRPNWKPASLLCSDLKMMARYAIMTDEAHRAIRRVIPGPYTFIFRATPDVPRSLTGKRKQVGIRVPDNNIVLSLIEELGAPILNVSARDREGVYLEDPRETERIWGRSLGAVIDGELLPPRESTVIDLTDRHPEVLREGLGDPSLFR